MGLLPRPARTALAAALHRLSPAAWDRLFAALPATSRPRQAGEKLHKVAGLLALDGEAAIYRHLVSQWQDPEDVVIGGREPLGLLSDESVVADIADFGERMQVLDTLTYLPDDILTKVDRTSMAVSLEARVPLLDPQVVEFAWRLPRSLKLRQGKGKWLLRQVLQRHVPPALFERPKMGFAIPIDGWLRGPLRDWAEDLLDERRLAADGLLDAAAVRQKWAEHLSGRRNWQYALWCVLMFQEWKRRWLDGNATASPRPLATAQS
jgi:asparagine synthase (glutamine-hydrolysing)